MFHDDIRALTAKKYEILGELEQAKAAIMREMSTVDKCSLTRLREIIDHYDRLEKSVISKLNANDTEQKTFIQYAENMRLELATELKALDDFKNKLNALYDDVNGLNFDEINVALDGLRDAISDAVSVSDENKRKISVLTDIAGRRIKPELSEEKKTQIVDLANAYYSLRNSGLFKYNVNVTRNTLADNSCYSGDAVQLDCSLFCQLLWAGVDPSTFDMDAGSYNGDVKKAFEWGYYFRFPWRKVRGYTNSKGNFYGYQQPNDTVEGSFSYYSVYDENSERSDKQSLLSMMDGANMANELMLMGCEIPVDETQVGDIVFFRALHTTDDDLRTHILFRNITHCGIVTHRSIDPATGSNTFTVLDCSPFYPSPFSKSSPPSVGVNFGASNYARGLYMMNCIVMSARHPSAFGWGGNVPDKFTTI